MPDLALAIDSRPRTGVLDLLAENRPFHSEFQLERFVIVGSGRTIWGMYCQALRELRTRWEALKIDYLRMRRIEYELTSTRGLGPWRRPVLDPVAQMERRSEAESLVALNRDREREFVWFLGVTRALKAELGDLTPAAKAELEAQTWRCKIREQVACELQASGPLAFGGGRISPATWAAVVALPMAWREELVKQIQDDPGALVNEWLNREVEIPVPPALPLERVRAIVEAGPCR